MTNCKYCKADCCNKGLDHRLKESCPGYIPMTHGDRFRAMSDEELVEKLFQAYRAAADWQEFSDLSMHWCDGKSGCIDADGSIECDEERHKACILRWLKTEAKP